MDSIRIMILDVCLSWMCLLSNLRTAYFVELPTISRVSRSRGAIAREAPRRRVSPVRDARSRSPPAPPPAAPRLSPESPPAAPARVRSRRWAGGAPPPRVRSRTQPRRPPTVRNREPNSSPLPGRQAVTCIGPPRRPSRSRARGPRGVSLTRQVLVARRPEPAARYAITKRRNSNI